MKIFLLVVLMLAGCLRQVPPPSLKPLPPPSQSPTSDVFTDYEADCSDPLVTLQRSAAAPRVQGCLDFDGGYDGCLAWATDSFSKDTIVCVVVELNIDWQRRIAKNTASDMQRANAKHANDWIRSHRLGVRR